MEGWLRLVKVFVVVAGMALAVGTTLLAILLVQRAGGPTGESDRPQTLFLPPGLRLVDVGGGGDALVLRLEDAAGVPHLLLVERNRGRVLALWRIEAAP